MITGQEQSVKPDFDEGQQYISLGMNQEALCQLKKYDETLIECNIALYIDSTNVEAYNTKGLVYQQLQNFKESMNSYALYLTQLIQFIRFSLKIQYLLQLKYDPICKVSIVLTDQEKSLLCFQESLKIDPSIKGMLLEHMNQIENALAQYQMAQQINPDDQLKTHIKVTRNQQI